MTDTLAEKLRQITAYDNDEEDILFEAADRIEELEEALGALLYGVGENGAPDELLETAKDALKGTKYE